MSRIVRAFTRWFVSRRTLHHSHALMDRELHNALDRLEDVHRRNVKLNHRIKDLEAHRNDWSDWEAELNG